MTPKKSLHLVVATDDQYLVLLAALVKSIEATLSNGYFVHLYVVADHVSKAGKRKLECSVDPALTQLHWNDMEEVVPHDMHVPVDRSSYPMNIYMRLFIPYFMPPGIEKVLYLDVDMIVNRDISTLFETSLGEHIVAAVRDPRIMRFDNAWGGVKNYRELGLAADTTYFNTGVLLMDLVHWRTARVTEKVIACIDAHKAFANYPDQYGLNVVLAGHWLQLDDRWNHFCTTEVSDPWLIHFVERKPIYSSYSNSSAYRKLFFEYLDRTAWKHFKLIGEPGRYFKKFKNMTAKFLP